MYHADGQRIKWPPWDGVPPKKSRRVIVISAASANEDPEYPFVLVIPTSTEPTRVTGYCLKLEKTDAAGNPIWARVPAFMALEKNDLFDLDYVMEPAERQLLETKMLQYLGLWDD